jgi:hypothetical protein
MPRLLPSLWLRLIKSPRSALLAFFAILAVFPLLPNFLTWPARLALLGLFVALGVRFFAYVRENKGIPKPFIFGAVAIFLTFTLAYGLLEAAAWFYLQKAPLTGQAFVMPDKHKAFIRSMISGKMRYEVYDEMLGWTIAKSQTSENGLYKSNAEGFRADREYSKVKPPEKTRVLTFGDSYTHGDEVENQDTWQTAAEQKAPDMEFLNFGVPGYSLAQAYLRYRVIAPDYPADFVIIGCMSEDPKRSVNVYYPFRYGRPEHSPSALALPYISLDQAGTLMVNPPAIANLKEYSAFLENPLPKLKEMAKLDILLTPSASTPLLQLIDSRWESVEDRLNPVVNYARTAWFGALNFDENLKTLSGLAATKNGDRRRLIVKANCLLFERFVREVESHGSVPLIMWFPSPEDLKEHNRGNPRQYEKFFDYFAQQKLAAVDTADWLQEIDGPDKPLQLKRLVTGVHFSPEANRYVGERMVRLIADMAAAKGTR